MENFMNSIHTVASDFTIDLNKYLSGEMLDQEFTILTLQQNFLANQYSKVGHRFIGWGLSLTSDENNSLFGR